MIEVCSYSGTKSNMSTKNGNIEEFQISDLKLRDIEIFLELTKALSVRELARRRQVQPGQISKLVKTLESRLGIKLFERSISGLTLTAAGKRFLPRFKAIKDAMRALEEQQGKAQEEGLKTVSIASSSFFVTHLIPELLAEYKLNPKFNLLELPPEEFVQVGLRGGFEICLHTGELEWPKTWLSEEIGDLNWELYARKTHPLLKQKQIRLDQVLKYPFVYPVYWTKEGQKIGDDGCPIRPSKRILGDKTATAQSAASIVRKSDQLGFLPSIVTKGMTGLAPLKLKSIEPVSKPVYLSVKMDQVSQKLFTSLIKKASTALKRT